MTVHPVHGSLKYDGKPAESAEVTLYPLTPFAVEDARQTIPYGIVGADGTFAISTYELADGAPLGEYAVTVVWPKVTIEGGEESRGPDQLRGAFRDPQKPLTKTTVVAGDNTLGPIDLQAR
jgi:hypothetical protein